MIRLTVALVVAVLALAGLSLSKHQEEGRLRLSLAARDACLSAVAGDDLAATNLRCDPEVAKVHVAAERSAVCDAALLTGELFLMRSSCTTEVKTLYGHREAESRRADSLQDILNRERADQAAAITRAEARARSETERKHRAEAALSGAPRDGDLLVLDADRLRQLRGEDAAAAPH